MFDWDEPIEIAKRIPGGPPEGQRVKTTPRAVISSPFDHRPEDILNSICRILNELITMHEAEAMAFEKRAQALSRPKKPEGEKSVQMVGGKAKGWKRGKGKK